MYLATTAIEEFWDKSQKIIFLGEWCKLYNRKKNWMTLAYKDIPFVWESADIKLNGIKYCDKVYEKALIQLTQILNTYNHINKDVHYYRIILGNWLICFIHQLYDKYLTLKSAFENYPDAQTWLLDEAKYYIPVDFNDFAQHFRDDKYALQLYSNILVAMGYDFKKKKLSKPIAQLLSYRLNFDLSPKRRLFDLMTRVLRSKSTIFHKRTITITDPYFSCYLPEYYLKLLFKSRFKFIFDDMKYKINLKFNIDQTMRKQELSLNGDEFESVLSKTLFSNIPILFVEGFAPFRDSVMRLPIHKSDAFFTANALHYDCIYKFYLAEHYKTITFLNQQHGGGYGIDFICIPEEYEKSIADRFYTAGWVKEAKTIPLAIQKFAQKRYSNCITSDMILFCISEMPRYVYKLDINTISSAYLSEHLSSIMTFLKHFLLRNKLLIRSSPHDNHYNWDTNERIAECFDDCFFDDFRKPFDQMLRKARIFITSNAHTTYLEALASNKPTVMFLPEKSYRFHPDAQPYFDRLQEVNILHKSPVTAAQHINAIYDDVDAWWQSNNVQEARAAFVEQYARSSPDWVNEWVKEFNRVVAKC
ncbi:MAG TPA: hypothetical protein ENH82_07190 [bacterium]|nr:hypothetical protein [bacterium]